LNTAVHLSGLIGPGSQIVMFTALGEDVNDWASKVLETKLKQCGIELKATRVRDKPTGVCVVLSGQGDRAFITSSGATSMYSPDDLNYDELAACDHLHLGGLFSLNVFVKVLPNTLRQLRARNPHLTISIDTNFDSNGAWGMPWLKDSLPLIDVIKVNEEEAVGVHKKAAASLPNEVEMNSVSWLASKVRIAAVVTRGKEGAIFACSSNPSVIVSVSSPVVDVVDACGAGDAWNAGFLAEWINNNRENIQRAVEIGCGCGALAVTSLGGCQIPVDRIKAEALLALNDGGGDSTKEEAPAKKSRLIVE